MKLTPPKMITFWIAVVLGLLGLLGGIGVIGWLRFLACFRRLCSARARFDGEGSLILSTGGYQNSPQECGEFSI